MIPPPPTAESPLDKGGIQHIPHPAWQADPPKAERGFNDTLSPGGRGRGKGDNW